MQVERISYKDEWLDNVIFQGKLILTELAKETFHRYREVGKLAIESGYEKGQWQSQHKQKALKEWAISQKTFSNMIRLGKMSELEFSNVITKFSSLYSWANHPKNMRNNDNTNRLITPYGENIFRLSTKFQTSRRDAYHIIKDGEAYPTLKRRSWFFHEDGREFSLREYARVQEFPDSFVFVGTIEQIKDQIGNAVPPFMAKHVASKFPPCNAIDLFAGAGGMSLGFQQANHNVVFAVEWDKACCYTYHANLPHTKIIQGDIKEVTTSALDGTKIDLVFGGPPCQGFSISGLRFKDDPRNQLYEEFLRIVQEIKPKYFVMENVLGILSFKDQILEDMRAIGYKASFEVVKGEDLGMRQHRHRVFFVGEA